MRAYPTRREVHSERIEAFLENASQETLNLKLYNREIRYLQQDYPIIIEKNKEFKNLALWDCIIRKK